MRRRARIDPGQGAIVKALRAAGFSVQSLASIGKGVPDLLVARAGQLWLLEVKAPEGPRGGQSASGQRLNTLQEMWRSGWRSPVGVVRTVDEALAYVNAL